MQFGLPSFNFGVSWGKSLYGEKGDAGALTLPKDKSATITIPSLGLDAILSHDGDLVYNSGKWSLGVATSLELDSPDIVSAAHFSSTRSAAGEVGLSFGKESARHFITLAHALATPKLSLHFKV